jgi:hypothetical protein
MADSRQLSDSLHDRGFVSRVASQVSLPYRRTNERQIVRHNGDLTVTFTAQGDEMPYGKWPRLFDAYLATMVTSQDSSYDTSRRRLYLGGTWRSFMKRLGANVGGSQLKVIRKQMENWFKTSYMVERVNDAESQGVAFQVGEGWRIDWLKDEPQDDVLPGFENWVEFGERFIEKVVCDNPVPVSLEALSKLGKSPMALDVYLWVNRRMSYLRESQLVPWKLLYQQFGSDSRMAKFKENFKKAVDRVTNAYPAVNVTISDERGVTLFPSRTSVPTTAQTRAAELLARQSCERSEQKTTKHEKREVSEGDIGRVLENIEYGDDFLAARRHVVHGLTAGYENRNIIDAWNAGERF